MPKLGRVSGQSAIRSLEQIGFVNIRQSGSHVILKRQTPEGENGCVVPLHNELAIGTRRGNLRQARVSVNEFMESL
jgi:predicted RNA binding protein YcfA (HicA-like mRNA interferase family)